MAGKSTKTPRVIVSPDATETAYKYDVAFSFLDRDERLAAEINDLVQDRLSTFLYSERQAEIAGTDGEKTFNEVFGREARVVAVLYREGWGKTRWTQIEETAIRGRAYHETYDFSIFIPLDNPVKVPKWLPPTQLWLNLKRFGVSGAAAVIEERVKRRGGEPRSESLEDRAARFERAMKFADRRKQFRGSDAGVRSANESFAQLEVELRAALDKDNGRNRPEF